MPGDSSPVQQSPALRFLCFSTAQTQQQQCLLTPTKFCWGNASEPKSREIGSKDVFITAAAIILGTKTKADITRGGERLFHKPGCVVGCGQLNQRSSRSLLTHNNEPAGILHCEALQSIQQIPLAIIGHGLFQRQRFWENILVESTQITQETQWQKNGHFSEVSFMLAQLRIQRGL